MKKLEIIIRPEKLEELKNLLDKNGVHGLNIMNIMGYGNQKGVLKKYRGTQYNANLLPKLKIATVVTDEISEKLITDIVDQIHTGNYGDGKIFISDVEDAVRIRTGERGTIAL